MYAHIEGIVSEKDTDTIVLDAHGVGYLLNVSKATLSEAPSIGEQMKLYCVLNVREDAMELYGFYSREEKRMYERLRTVTGIGSKIALQILSSMSVRELSVALVTGNAEALTRVPGIGKKTAQRLVLELKDKVSDDELKGDSSRTGVRTTVAGPEAEAISALVALGYSSADASAAVASVAGKSDKTDELIFMALRAAARE